MTTRAAVYCRISSDREDNRKGVVDQEHDCRDLCESEGWEVIGPYVDNDITAADPTKRRPEYERLVGDMAEGLFDVIVVAATDRLWRQPLEQEQLIADCLRTGMTRVTSLRRDYDVATDDVDMLRIEGVFAAGEVRRIKRRVKRRKLQKAQAGEFHGGPRPFGYGEPPVDDSPEAKRGSIATYTQVNETEAELVRDAASRVLEGDSLGRIRADWTEATGRNWSVTTVKRVLVNPRIAGLRVHQGVILEGVETEWPAILDRTTWEQVCAYLSNPARSTGPRTGSYPLVGVLRCALCGELLKATPRSGRGRAYGCKKATGGCGRVFALAGPIEAEVRRAIVPVADSPHFLDEVFAVEAEHAERAREIVAANATDETRLTELGDMLGDGEIDRASYARQTARLRDRISSRADELASLRGQTALGRYAGAVEESWETMPIEDQRMVLLAIVESITVGKVRKRGSNHFDRRRLTPNWNYASLARLSGSEDDYDSDAFRAEEEAARWLARNE